MQGDHLAPVLGLNQVDGGDAVARPQHPVEGCRRTAALQVTQDLDAFWVRIREPEVVAAIRADEANFLLSDRTLMYEVQEHLSD